LVPMMNRAEMKCVCKNLSGEKKQRILVIFFERVLGRMSYKYK